MRRAVLGVLVLAFAAAAQAPQFTPTEEQQVELRISSLDSQKAQAVWLQEAYKLPSYASYQQAQKALESEAQKIKAENKWPASVEFNQNAGAFYDTKPEKK